MKGRKEGIMRRQREGDMVCVVMRQRARRYDGEERERGDQGWWKTSWGVDEGEGPRERKERGVGERLVPASSDAS